MGGGSRQESLAVSSELWGRRWEWVAGWEGVGGQRCGRLPWGRRQVQRLWAPLSKDGRWPGGSQRPAVRLREEEDKAAWLSSMPCCCSKNSSYLQTQIWLVGSVEEVFPSGLLRFPLLLLLSPEVLYSAGAEGKGVAPWSKRNLF